MTYHSGSNTPLKWPDSPTCLFLMTDLLRRASYLGGGQEFPDSASIRECHNIGVAFSQIPRLEVFRHYVKHSHLYEGGITMDGLFDWLSILSRYFKRLKGFKRADI